MTGVREWWTRARPHDATEDLAVDGHAIHLYVDDGTLLDRLESYVTDGWLHGQRTVVFAEHERLKELRLRLASWHLGDALEAHDANWALGHLLREGKPAQEQFDSLMASTLGKYAPGTVRLFSELSAVLWKRGNSAAAFALQAMWHAYLLDRPIPRLSVYGRDTALELPEPRSSDDPD